MISTTYAFPGLEVKGQGSILASPALYKNEQNGARVSCRQSRWGSRVSLKSESGKSSLEGSESRVELESELRVETRELVNGAGMRRGARWQTRGLRGDHRREKGRSGDHSQGEFAGAKAVQGARSNPVSLRVHQRAKRASTCRESVNNSHPPAPPKTEHPR